jgi:exopolyphosphatase/guanosine-5'-triphosphate,3'-diphosphate pyrophosphatase
VPGSARDTRPVYGAVDLGTHNCRMLMATPAESGLRVVGSFSRIVRLGEGLAATGRLAEEAIARAVAALGICARKMRNAGVRQVQGVATEACRRAENCEDFLEIVHRRTGLRLETISDREEAELTLAGCGPLLDTNHRRAIVFDIGGGSTEIMWTAQEEGNQPRIIDSISIPVGVVTLAENCAGDALATAHYGRDIAGVETDLGAFCARHGIADAVANESVGMLGTSGTVTTLGAFHLGLARYDRSRVNGIDVAFERIRALTAELAAMGFAARAAHPCIGRGRADLVVAGCAILEAICRRWPVGSLRVADRGIREGLLLRMMDHDGFGPSMRAGDGGTLAPPSGWRR